MSYINQLTLTQAEGQQTEAVNSQQHPIILNSVLPPTTLQSSLPQSGSDIQPQTQNSTLLSAPALSQLDSSSNLPQPGSVLSTPLGQFSVVATLPKGYQFVNMDSTPVLHIADCDPSSANVLTGQVNTTKLIDSSDKKDSTGEVETVKIVQLDMPESFQNLINESPSSKPTTSKHKTPKGGVLSQKKPPKKQKRFRNYSSPGHLSSAFMGSSPFHSPGLFLSDETSYENEQEGKDLETAVYPCSDGEEQEASKEGTEETHSQKPKSKNIRKGQCLFNNDKDSTLI